MKIFNYLYLSKNGIKHELTGPGNPAQNKKPTRLGGMLDEKTRALIYNVGDPKK